MRQHQDVAPRQQKRIQDMAQSKVLIENDKTIVTEWSFKVGDSTGHHTHKYNYIVVPMLDGELKIIDNKNNETISKLTVHSQ